MRRAVNVSVMSLLTCAGLAHGQLQESFDNVGGLPGAGWTIQNASTPPVTEPAWYQGVDTVFPAQAGAPTAYAATNYNRTTGQTGTETISAWMVTPVVTVSNGDTVRFFTRTVGAPAYPDRLQVRMSTAGGASVVPTGPTEVGSFTTSLLEINAAQTTSGYPNTWTEYNAPISGLAGPTQVRIAFRYYVENAGPAGLNSDYIGLDEVTIGTVILGACCRPDFACSLSTAASCTAAGGSFLGNNTVCGNCPAPPSGTFVYQGGAVAIPDGTGTAGCGATAVAEIVVPTSFNVTTANARVYIPHSWQGDVQFRLVHGATSLPLVTRPGVATIPPYGFDVDNFGASSLSPMSFNAAGTQTYSDPPLTAGVPSVTGDWIPIGGPMSVFAGQNAQGAWRLEAEDCAGGDTGSLAYFRLELGGGAAQCYPNCDNSTTAPVLNVQDFTCFLQRYAAGDTYANCDNSTTAPTLNVQDFTCFLQSYAAGCP
jgi:subtilisin-like proprotein convertase family protein